MGDVMSLQVSLRIKDDLCDARSITKIDEDDHAMITPTLNPAIQDDGLTDLILTQLSTAVSSDVHATFTFFPENFLLLSGLAQPSFLTGRFGLGTGSSPRSTEATRSSANARNALASRSVRNRNSPGSRLPSERGPIRIRMSLRTG